jgi:dTDP-4-amino-4,6-dideoxygalactose transaminase
MRFKLGDRLRRAPGRIVYYGNASHGYYEVLTWLARRRGTAAGNVLMPAYIPAKLYRTALAAGVTPRFYDLDTACRFDPAAVEALVDSGTLAIFAVHYFGLPARLTELRRIATARGIWLIEDCALTLPTWVDGAELGRVGDCALFSVRKMLLMPEGGILALNRRAEGFRPSYRARVPSAYTAWHLLRTRAKRWYVALARGRDPLALARCPATGYVDRSERQEVRVKAMSRLTRTLSGTIDVERVAAARRANYVALLAGLGERPELEPLRPDLPEGCTPYSLPFLAPPGRRAALREHLRRHGGVGCGAGWPESPFESRLPGTEELAERVLELPVHHLLPERQRARLLEALRTFDGATRWN